MKNEEQLGCDKQSSKRRSFLNYFRTKGYKREEIEDISNFRCATCENKHDSDACKMEIIIKQDMEKGCAR